MPLAPAPCLPQLQEDTSEWEGLVARAFEALDPDGDGRITLHELEQVLCGEEGCEVGGPA